MESEYAENCGDATAIGAAMKMRVFGAGRDTVTTTVSLHTSFNTSTPKTSREACLQASPGPPFNPPIPPSNVTY